MKRQYKRIVAKFGTNLLTGESDSLDLEQIRALVNQVAQLRREDVDVIVVTSGAVAAGRARLGLAAARKDVNFRQVLAAVGQGQLMQAYDGLFAENDMISAQTLLTRRDLSDRLSYLNARNTLLALLQHKVVPIVNENDAVAVEELAESRIGENDTLAALTANLVDADLLVMLMTREGLFTADPQTDSAATLVRQVERIDSTIESYAGGSEIRGTGGMITKLNAAQLAIAGGADVVVASGREPDILTRLAKGEEIGTAFPSSADRIESRKRWILSGLTIRGSIVVDTGAAQALVDRKSSLLPAGVKQVNGPFDRGETVAISTQEDRRIACGITNYSAEELEAIRGSKSAQIADILGHDYGAEAVHRDNLVMV